MLLCSLLIFFQNQFFRKIISGIASECQTVQSNDTNFCIAVFSTESLVQSSNVRKRVIILMIRIMPSNESVDLKNNFLLFSTKTYDVGTQKNCLNETFF